MEIDPADGPRTQHYYFAHQYLRERAQRHPALLIEELQPYFARRRSLPLPMIDFRRIRTGDLAASRS
jgi:hypothetical protein